MRSCHVKLSLGRCSAWYSALGLLDKNAIDPFKGIAGGKTIASTTRA